ncbi:MAG: TraB/GumN family protein [Endozoicomonas sp.]
MKSQKISLSLVITLILLICSAFSSIAQCNNERLHETWKIIDPASGTVVGYLAGTIHVPASLEELFQKKPSLKKTVDSSDNILFERLSPITYEELFDCTNGLSSYLNKEELSKALSKLQYLLHVHSNSTSPQEYESLIQKSDCLTLMGVDLTHIREPRPNMEFQLFRYAEERGKVVAELDVGVYWQNLLSARDKREILIYWLKSDDYLYQTYEDTLNEVKFFNKQLLKCYFSSGCDTISMVIRNHMTKSQETPWEVLLHPERTSSDLLRAKKEELYYVSAFRNQEWLKIIEPILKYHKSLGTSAFIVGLGHLFEEQGLIKQLRDRGYILAPFKEKPVNFAKTPRRGVSNYWLAAHYTSHAFLAFVTLFAHYKQTYP